MLEFYQAYADYNDMMDLTEDMMRLLVLELIGKTSVCYQGGKYDFGKPCKRMTVIESIMHINPGLSVEELMDPNKINSIADNLNVTVEPSSGLGKVQIEIF